MNSDFVTLDKVLTKLTDGSHNPPPKYDGPDARPMLSAKSVNNDSIDFTDCRWVEPSAFDLERKRGDVTTGDVLLTIVGTIGRCAVVPIDKELVVLQRSVALLRPKPLLDSKFLSFQLQGPSLQAWMVDNARGVAQLGLYLGSLKKLPLWCPPLPTQYRIVAEIEEKLSRLDAAQSALLRAQANLKRYRASALKQTYGLNHNSSELPEGWEWTTIGKQFRVEVGATPSRKEATYWNGEIPWVSSGEVQFCRVHETTETITQLGYQNSSTKLNPVGSVLLAMIGQGKTRGQAAILEIEAANNQNCAAIWVGKTQTPPEFVYYWFMLQYDETRRIGSGNNQQALNKSLVQALALPWPPLAAQKKIVEEVERRLSVIDRTEQTLRTQLERAKRLRQSILQQAFAP